MPAPLQVKIMADENNLTGKVGLDTTNFKANVTELNREMRVVESRFRATAAGMADWGKSASGLELRISSLTTKMGLQEKKIKNLTEEYKLVVAEKGATSRAAQDLEIKINKEVEALGKMEHEANNAKEGLKDLTSGTDKAGEEVKELGDKSDHATGKMGSFKGAIQGLGGVIKASLGIVLALAAAVAAIAGAIGGLVFSTANTAAGLVDLSAKTGISTTKLQELAYIGEQVGTDLDTITGAFSKLTRSIGAGSDAFGTLGVSLTGSNGQLRDTEDIFQDTLAALAKIPNETERDALAMEIFGKSAMELNPLIKTTSDEMNRLTAEAHAVGAVMSEENVAAFEEFDDTMSSLKAGLQGTLGTLAGAFLPTFQTVFDTAGGYLREFAEIVKGSDGDFGKMAEGIGGLVQKIVADLAAQAPKMLEGGLKILQSILKGLTQNLPIILKAVIDILKSLLGFLVDNLPMMMEAGIEILLTLVTAIIDALPMLIDAALQMIITLALGIAEALPTLIPAVVEMLITVVNTLIENIPMLIDAALQLLLGLAKGILAALPILIAAAPKILIGLVNGIIQSLPILIEMTPQMLGAIIFGIIAALPMLAEAALEIVLAITKAVLDLTVRIISIGEDIVKGVWQGMLAKKDWFFSQVRAFFQGIVDTVKKILGITSPSKLFANEIGINIPAGVGVGIMKGMPALHKQLSAAMRGLTGSAELAFNGSLGAGGVGSSINNSRSYQYVNHISNAGIDANELARIQRRQELLYGT